VGRWPSSRTWRGPADLPSAPTPAVRRWAAGSPSGDAGADPGGLEHRHRPAGAPQIAAARERVVQARRILDVHQQRGDSGSGIRSAIRSRARSSASVPAVRSGRSVANTRCTPRCSPSRATASSARTTLPAAGRPVLPRLGATQGVEVVDDDDEAGENGVLRVGGGGDGGAGGTAAGAGVLPGEGAAGVRGSVLAASGAASAGSRVPGSVGLNRGGVRLRLLTAARSAWCGSVAVTSRSACQAPNA